MNKNLVKILQRSKSLYSITNIQRYLYSTQDDIETHTGQVNILLYKNDTSKQLVNVYKLNASYFNKLLLYKIIRHRWLVA